MEGGSGLCVMWDWTDFGSSAGFNRMHQTRTVLNKAEQESSPDVCPGCSDYNDISVESWRR